MRPTPNAYPYANSLAMLLGPDPRPASAIEVLTGSPFGFELIAGRLPSFDPYGWDPDRGIDDAIALLGWACHRRGADDDEGALAGLREALATGAVLAGPMEIGLLRHQPGMDGPIGSDHFVVVLEVDGELIRFHDPHGHPHATLPIPVFLAAWRADSISYRSTPYTMRSGFHQVRATSTGEALRAALPGAVAWLRGRDELPVTPGTTGGAVAVRQLAELVVGGLAPSVHAHLVHFGIRVGARRLADAAAVLSDLGQVQAAALATRQARLVGGLQYDLVAGDRRSAATTLLRLAPTYAELADALAAVSGRPGRTSAPPTPPQPRSEPSG